MPETAPLVAVREATADDAATLADVGSRAFTAAYAAHSDAEDLAAHIAAHFSAAAVAAALAAGHCRYLLATVQAQAAGLARFRTGNIPAAIPSRRAVEIQQLYVLPAAQGSGIGARLVAGVARRLSEFAAEGIWLSAWEDADWAIGFYRAIGFETVGTADFFLAKSRYTDVLMWLPADRALALDTTRGRKS